MFAARAESESALIFLTIHPTLDVQLPLGRTAQNMLEFAQSAGMLPAAAQQQIGGATTGRGVAAAAPAGDAQHDAQPSSQQHNLQQQPQLMNFSTLGGQQPPVLPHPALIPVNAAADAAAEEAERALAQARGAVSKRLCCVVVWRGGARRASGFC